MFEPKVFRKQMYCIEKVIVTLLGFFGAPAVILRSRCDSAPGELRSTCPSSLRPWISLGQFGDAVSSTGRSGDCSRKCFIPKSVFLK